MKKVLDQLFGTVDDGENTVLKDISRARERCAAEELECPPRPEVEVSLRLITPGVAQDMKRNMMRNRHLSEREVKKLEEEMKNGRFYCINQGIGILDDGQTADGQHRIEAIIRSGKPQWMIVASGLSREAMLAIDRGRARTMQNFLDILGNPHSGVFSSGAKVVLKAKKAWAKGFTLSSAQTQTFPDSEEWDLILAMYEGVDDSAVAAAARKMHKSGIPPSVGAAFYYLASADLNTEWVDEFVTDVEGARAGKAGHTLAQKVKDLKSKKPSQMEVLAYMIWAFGKFVAAKTEGIDEDVRQLKLPRDGKLPRLPEA